MTRIVIAGATGLIGRQAVTLLAATGAEIHALVRRPLEAEQSGIVVHIAQASEWPDMIAGMSPDIAISCVGTTMQTAGSRDAFHAVDHDLVLAFAKAARGSGARQMILVSSVGAMPASSSFYLRTKAEVEAGVRTLNFDRLDIIRPGLLTGGTRSDNRPGESLGIMLAPLTDKLLFGQLTKYRSTSATNVAKAIVALSKCSEQGRFIHENDSIAALAC